MSKVFQMLGILVIALFLIGCQQQPQLSTTPPATTTPTATEHAGHTTSSTTPKDREANWDNAPIIKNAKNPLPYTLEEGVKVFELTLDMIKWEILPGVTVDAYAFNSQVPGPEIRVKKGDRVRIHIKNNIPEGTAIHWHGLLVPNDQDGVETITQPSIEPGSTYTYEFTVPNSGTHFYHAHGHARAADQLDRGLYGAFVVEDESDPMYDAEYTMIFDEWTRTAAHAHTMDEYIYFTINGKAHPVIPDIEMKPGQKIRLRLINAGFQDHPMHIHGHAFTITHADGWKLPQPYKKDTIVIGPGERYDVELIADNTSGTWMFHCHQLHHVSNDGVEPGGLMMLIKY